MTIKVIIVDDHELVRKGLIMLMEKKPHLEVIGEASSGSEALDILGRHTPDVFILDIAMPNMDGIETARKIHALSPGIRILALSRHSERDYVADMFAAGASGYLLKDSAPNELVQAIETVARGEKYVSPSLMDVVLEGFTGESPAHTSSGLDKLTQREKEILVMVADGKSSKEIAFDLQLSVKTVDTYRQQIMRKLNIFNVAELTKFAIRTGLITL